MSGPSSGAPPVTEDRRAVTRESLAVGVATGLYGASFGAVSVAAGLSVLQTCALSALVFTGASQFALVGVVAAGGAPLSGAATALLLGSRNAFYGLRLAPRLGLRGWRRFVGAQVVIDESAAMALVRRTDGAARRGFWVTGAAVFAFWNLFTLLGALAGEALGDPRTWGLDAAVGGAFLALLWPRLADRAHLVTGLVAAALALSLVPVVPAGVPVLAAAGVALVVGLLPTAGAGRRTDGEAG